MHERKKETKKALSRSATKGEEPGREVPINAAKSEIISQANDLISV